MENDFDEKLLIKTTNLFLTETPIVFNSYTKFLNNSMRYYAQFNYFCKNKIQKV